jgi:hypothetical protein
MKITLYVTSFPGVWRKNEPESQKKISEDLIPFISQIKIKGRKFLFGKKPFVCKENAV